MGKMTPVPPLTFTIDDLEAIRQSRPIPTYLDLGKFFPMGVAILKWP